MIDLEGAGPATAVRTGHALVLVTDEDLERIVLLLLRQAGFDAERVDSVAQLGTLAERTDVRVVVLLGGTDAVGAHPLGGFVPPAERAYRVIALVAGAGGPAMAAGADQVVQLPFDPGAFTAELLALE
jgi:hypothetical protein